jgi:hypothetical protein
MDFQDCYRRGAWLAWEAGPMAEMTRNRSRDNQVQLRLGESGDKAVRILTELTSEFERFDSMIDDQRSVLEHPARRSRRVESIDREFLRFRLEAAEMATRTRKALDQLRQLAEPAKPGDRSDSRERRTG